MGKGQIIAHSGGGLYSVRLTYAYRSRITARLATYTAQIAELDVKIAAETDANKKAILKLQRASIQKLHDYYSTKMPDDPTVSAWCADLTEDLAYGTNVGTIEIPGEQVTVLVRPAYNGRSVYLASRDGQLMPSIAGSPHQVLFNWMLLPGWQRHKPIYRTGTIIAGTIDNDANTCSVCLEPAYSSQQSLPAIDGLAIGDCNTTNPVASQITDFCTRNPGHPFCTNTDEGSEINLTDGQLAELKAVNEYVNQNYGRLSDPSGYRTGDSWDVMAPGGSGDCEDHMLTKMQKLVDDYGWNPANLKVVTSYMKDGTGHVFLAVRTTNRGLVALDVNNDNVIEAGKLPYRIDKVSLTKDVWRSFTRQLDSVPVEYMTCNSWAFIDGDRVVVEFTGQKWETPKVIGFHSSPQACSFNIYCLCNWYYGVGVMFSTDTWTFHALGVMPLPYAWRYRCAGAAIGSSILCVSGLGFIYGATSPPYIALIDKNTQFDSLTYSYTDKQAIPTPRECLTGYGYGGKAWFAGGISIFDAGWYGPETTSSTDVYACGFGPLGFDCPDWMNSFYLTAPQPYLNNEEFTFLSNSWAYRQGFPDPRGFARGFGASGLLYIFGGVDGKIDKTVVCTCCLERYMDGSYGREYTTYSNEYINLISDGRAYNPTSDAWASLQDMPENRAGYASAVVSGIGYVFHGSVSDSLSSGDLRQSAELRLEDDDIPIPDGYPEGEYFSWGTGSCSYTGGAFELWKTMTARKYNPTNDSWASIATSPNNGELYPTNRDYFGTGISGNEGYPAAAFGGRIALCQSTSMTSENGDNTVMEYNPVADTYTGRGSKAQMAEVMGASITHFGELGFTL